LQVNELIKKEGDMMGCETKIIWPEVITNPDFEYTGEKIKERAIADGLKAWACSRMERRPENFGFGIIKISKVIGSCVATEERLRKLSDEILGK
jgi:hypothetical protein